ncbi:MAG TPA: cupredoxin domain-containing protein [Candidatus Dojkabacteria bacterium]|nr:cupredoxin domain-containing protein [Candidatus Dojkabacteria bacterium]
MSKRNRDKNYNQNSKNGLVWFFIFAVVVIGVFLLLILSGSGQNETTGGNIAQAQTDPATGKQLIKITAKGGYKPGTVEAKAGVASILQVSTTNTFDCSLGLRIPSLGISKNLPTTGITSIEIPAQAAGTTVKGTCTMGMYWFSLKFT